MQPSSSKRAKIDSNLAGMEASKALQPSCGITLPDDIVIYIGRLIVKHPALHLFFPASRKLAQHATKIFQDFAAKGGALKFYSRDLLKAVQFAVSKRLNNLNLSTLNTGKDQKEAETAQALGKATYLTVLAINDNFWIRELLPRFSSLENLSLQNYTVFEGAELETSKLTRLSLAIPKNSMGYSPMPSLARLPLLKSLKLSALLLYEEWPKQMRTLSNLRSLDLVGHEDECTYDESLSELEISDLYNTNRATFTNLTSLKLNDQSKVAWHLHVILDSLTGLRTLKFKRIRGTPASHPAEASVASHLSKLIHLEHLALENLQLDERVFESLVETSCLRSLCVSGWHDTFGKESAKEYFTCIEALTALKTLDLAHQSLDFTSFQSLGKLTNLKKLHLGVARGLPLREFEELKKLGQLTMLDLSYALKNVHTKALTLFSQLSSLTKLQLDSEDCIDRLPLESMPNLRKLHVSDYSSSQTQEEHNITTLTSCLTRLTNLNSLHIDSFRLTLDLIQSTCNQLSQLQELGIPKGLFASSLDDENLAQLQSFIKLKKIRLVRLKDN